MSKLSPVLLSVLAVTFVAAQNEEILYFKKGIFALKKTSEKIYHKDGQIVSAAGAPKDDGSQYVKGAYSFVSPDGVTHWVTHTADDEGFHIFLRIDAGQDAEINPNALKSLIGQIG